MQQCLAAFGAVMEHLNEEFEGEKEEDVQLADRRMCDEQRQHLNITQNQCVSRGRCSR